MKVRRIPLPKALLLQMPTSERSFFLLAGHMLNELNSLHKIFSWCIHAGSSDSSTAMESLANGVQAQIYARLLAGKLLEAWRALESAFFATRISQSLQNKLHLQAKEGLNKVKTYFSKPNTISRVRNSFAFHYSVEEFDAHWHELADEGAFEFVLGGTIGNNLALASELVVNTALLNSINPVDRESALNTYFDEVQSVAASFTVFLEGAIIVFMEVVLKSPLAHQGHEEEIAPCQRYEEVAIPYFYNHGFKE
ncbi:MAG: hypothetical protein KIT40_14805 [Nitrospira sp.]|nr:hypothetical protein [Nitrospira sp.]